MAKNRDHFPSRDKDQQKLDNLLSNTSIVLLGVITYQTCTKKKRLKNKYQQKTPTLAKNKNRDFPYPNNRDNKDQVIRFARQCLFYTCSYLFLFFPSKNCCQLSCYTCCYYCPPCFPWGHIQLSYPIKILTKGKNRKKTKPRNKKGFYNYSIFCARAPHTTS